MGGSWFKLVGPKARPYLQNNWSKSGWLEEWPSSRATCLASTRP
jgi:hypothetical protein